MMDETTSAAAWLYCFDTGIDCPLKRAATTLTQAGVAAETCGSMDAAYAAATLSAPSMPGIVFFSAATPELCDFVRDCSQHGLRRLLAVTTLGDLPAGMAWQVLAAGASDVLRWDVAGDITGTIEARLRRWHEVDTIVALPLVRNHLVGESAAWRGLLRQVVEVARFAQPDHASVLLIGETGTGKELIARLIHSLSPQRSEHDLIVLDGTTIVPELSGSELYGHERGAFTGAVSAREGAFALANGGTLFLDEVGELSLVLQAQLLRVVQEHTYKRVGGNTWQKTDFRLVAATNRDLVVEEANGRFRSDLYYRLAGWSFRLPPLRERAEDIIPLARHFLRQRRPGQEPPELDEPVQVYLLTRSYPGNVRDLRNLVLRMAERHVGRGPITIGDVPLGERLPALPMGESWRDLAFEEAMRCALLRGASLREIRRAAEETAVRIVLGEEDGNLQRAARRLGITDRALQMRRAEQRQRTPGPDAPS
jgi:transcriptional regulator with GAF, ATPase, and Fis domain